MRVSLDMKTHKTDIIVLGAGAAGMMAAIEAGRRGRNVVVLDHAKKPGEKIRISGGGRCNFTNIHCDQKNFLSQNTHFARSALAGYTQHNFIARVQKRGIAFHEKTLGQLFCDGSAKEIIAMLTDDMAEAGVDLRLSTEIFNVEKNSDKYCIKTSVGDFEADSLIVATGGKSIPKMGATGIAYDIARQFGHRVIETRAGLVPFTWASHMVDVWSGLSGVALDVSAKCNGKSFEEAMLFTHRGLSGPAMLQISSYWQDGQSVTIDLVHGRDMAQHLKDERQNRPKVAPHNVLGEIFPKRFAQVLAGIVSMPERLADMNNKAIEALGQKINAFEIIPGGTEGYRTAEVTLGGVDTSMLNQKTMESKIKPNLYFIGEAVDVTGHLGGHNFQWAWSSGFAAGNHA